MFHRVSKLLQRDPRQIIQLTEGKFQPHNESSISESVTYSEVCGCFNMCGEIDF